MRLCDGVELIDIGDEKTKSPYFYEPHAYFNKNFWIGCRQLNIKTQLPDQPLFYA